LIIGRYDKKQRIYEMGVVPAPEHFLSICYEITGPRRTTATRVVIPKEGRIWQLGIVGQSSDAELFFNDPEPDRLNPSAVVGSPERKDFRWVLDLENETDFPEHTIPMPLRRNKLGPILLIKNGIVYSTELTETLERTLNGQPDGKFGAASDSIAVDLDVKVGQEVVLFNTQLQQDIFRIRLGEGELVSIFINNLPEQTAHGTTLHFKFFYDVFDVSPEQQYGFSLLSSPEDAQGEGHIRESHFELHEDRDHHVRQESLAREIIPESRAKIEASPQCGSERGHPGFICGTCNLGQSDESLTGE
jgi:hypothetical protein